MKSPVRILHLEDNSNDATLVAATLENADIHCEITCVANRAAYLAALEAGEVDLVLADFSVPAFDGFAAIAAARRAHPTLPVILVSGTIGEELAIDSLKSGATDYVLKGRLSRLAPAVLRAMGEVEERAERRALEAQYIEAQKMEVVGQLASGVAHDFNNILMVVLGYCDLLATELGTANSLQNFVKEIRLAGERASGLTRQLLVCSRNQTVQPVPLDLTEVIHSVEQLLRRLIGENIEMLVAPGADCGPILADSGYLGQVLMNLVVNARDAMPNGGRISIVTSNVTLPIATPSAPADLPPGPYVLLSVSDTGTGMTEEVKARLFEAFFTTKPAGRGTGLGLATCQTIVRKSGGRIGIRTAVGQGTTFEIYFPRLEALVSPGAEFTPVGLLPRGTETVLFVEDEPAVRDLSSGILRHQGYEVLTASNGKEGLEVVSRHRGAPLRLVVTDVIMPLMSGQAMAERLKRLYPEVRILYISGYTDDFSTLVEVKESGMEFFPKPYSSAQLARKVREILDRGGPL